jgi:hypothetical protein
VIAALSKYAQGQWMEASSVEGDGAPSFGAIAAIAAYVERIGLRAHFSSVGAERGSQSIADTVLVMLANRLCDPASKRRRIVEWLETVQLPEGAAAPFFDQRYRTLGAHYCRLTDLANLDLRLALYDLTSICLEMNKGPSEECASRSYGYSRDKRGHRPQVVIGLLVTGNGIPIAHHVFPGNIRDSTTLPEVMADYQQRFGIGKIALVADRGLISEGTLAEVTKAGFDHVLATRLHRDAEVEGVLEAAVADGSTWVEVTPTTTATEVVEDGTRYVAVSSTSRKARDDHRREELLARTEDKLVALGERVRAGRPPDPATNMRRPIRSFVTPEWGGASRRRSITGRSAGTSTAKPSTTRNDSLPGAMGSPRRSAATRPTRRPSCATTRCSQTWSDAFGR